ncbi:hypothetical protein GLE_3077 [Lysobacter enzymogenes]|uniref:Uncharacterized protein n=1 Tax=Lysobacter enzymogenes TaxID=69 RepID=A0A0S2DJG5_LYSEN|nr:hypothetical protein GLE_3077 [Lysobacter enzymogenes]
MHRFQSSSPDRGARGDCRNAGGMGEPVDRTRVLGSGRGEE